MTCSVQNNALFGTSNLSSATSVHGTVLVRYITATDWLSVLGLYGYRVRVSVLVQCRIAQFLNDRPVEMSSPYRRSVDWWIRWCRIVERSIGGMMEISSSNLRTVESSNISAASNGWTLDLWTCRCWIVELSTNRMVNTLLSNHRIVEW